MCSVCELSRDEKQRLDDFWNSEVEDKKKMYWSMDDRINKSETKILSKSLITILVGYALVLFAGILFLVIPNQVRKNTLKDDFGLDPNRT